MKKYYIAYGSNLNVEQMRYRCPDARIVGTSVIPDYQLLFKGSKTGSYLTIEKKKGASVPVAVWEVSEHDEQRLDAYEGYPNFYYKTDMQLTAVIDWNTRFIVGYALSDTLDAAPVLEAVKKAVRQYGKPEIINSDQGSQFTSEDYTGWLKEKQIRQSMDGKARWADNVMIERWFRSLKCELIYINEFQTPRELRQAIGNYIQSYNTERPHASLDYHYPADLYPAA